MSSPALEAFLARLYVEEALLDAFLNDPEPILAQSHLAESERSALRRIDRAGLVLAVRSFRIKRAHHARARSQGPVRRALARLFR